MRPDLTDRDTAAVSAFSNFLSWGERPVVQRLDHTTKRRDVPPAWFAYVMGSTTWCPPKGAMNDQNLAHDLDFVIRCARGASYPMEMAQHVESACDRLQGVHVIREKFGDDLHLIEFRDDGWTIQHTLEERLDRSLFDCRRNWTGGDPGVRGRFILNDDGTLDRWEGTAP